HVALHAKVDDAREGCRPGRVVGPGHVLVAALDPLVTVRAPALLGAQLGLQLAARRVVDGRIPVEAVLVGVADRADASVDAIPLRHRPGVSGPIRRAAVRTENSLT